jgi:hypothetical protein
LGKVIFMNTLPASGQHNVAVVRIETTGNCGLRFRHSHTLCHRGINKNESHTLNDSAHAAPNIPVVLTHVDFWLTTVGLVGVHAVSYSRMSIGVIVLVDPLTNVFTNHTNFSNNLTPPAATFVTALTPGVSI